MSRQNVQLVRRAIDRFNAGDVGGAFKVMGDEVVMDWSNSIGPHKGVYRGRDGVFELLRSFRDAWEWVRWDPVEVIDVDEQRVIVVNHVRMRGRGSGVDVDATGAQVWSISDGAAETITLYQSKADALEAVRRTG